MPFTMTTLSKIKFATKRSRSLLEEIVATCERAKAATRRANRIAGISLYKARRISINRNVDDEIRRLAHRIWRANALKEQELSALIHHADHLWVWLEATLDELTKGETNR